METVDIVSVDTNVLVRFLVEDDPIQFRAAKQIFEERSVFIPESVLLETEWVLRAVFEASRKDIHAAFSKLLRLPRVHVPDLPRLRQVLVYFEDGFDFADALHLLRSEGHELKTFDAALVKKAKKAGHLTSSP